LAGQDLILIGPATLIGLAFNETERLGRFFIPSLLAIEGLIAGVIVVHIVVQFMLDDTAHQIVGQINNSADLSTLWHWLKPSWSTRKVAAVALLICPFSVLLFVTGFSLPLHQFVGFGFSLASILAGLLAGVMYYAAAWAFLLIANLKAYQYDMNAFAPADSEILSAISDMVTRGIYILAAYFAVITLIFTSSLIEPSLRAVFAFPILVIGWTFIAAQFLLTRSTLHVITNRAKWVTLNRLRTKINALEATGDLADKETAERLFRLADIHRQIMASKTNTLDLKSISTLLSQLMLPLLGLLLAILIS
jgi:hypothetical protein